MKKKEVERKAKGEEAGWERKRDTFFLGWC